MTVMEFLGWWQGQLGSMLPEAWQDRRRRFGRMPVAALMLAPGDTPLILAITWPAGRNQPERQQIVSLGAAPRAQLLQVFGPGRTTIRLRLPPGVLLQRDVVLPIAAERALDRVVHLELDRLTPFRAEEVFWSCRMTRRDPVQGRLHMRLTLAPRDTLAPLLDTLASAGIVPALLEAAPAPGALDSAWRRIEMNAAEPSVRKPLLRAGMAACAGLAAAIAVVPFVRQSLALGAIATRIDAVAPDAAEASALRQRLAAAAAGGDVMERQRQRLGDALQALAAVTDALPDDTWLTDLTLNQRRLTLAGRSATAVRLIARLSAQPALRNAAFNAPVTHSEARSGDLFSISAELAP